MTLKSDPLLRSSDTAQNIKLQLHTNVHLKEFFKRISSVSCWAEHRTRVRTASLMSDGVCSFLSLLSVYLKSQQIVSAGSPEVKPAEAHASCSLCYAPRSSCDLWPLVIPPLSRPSFLSLSPVELRLPCGGRATLPFFFFDLTLSELQRLFITQRKSGPSFFFFI